MTIQYCSDLHLEFRENDSFIGAYPLLPSADILILAGDICLFSQIFEYHSYFCYLSDYFSKIYWIPGNHEYYGSDIGTRSGSFIEEIVENVFLLNNQTIQLDGVRLIFSTLWSPISANNRYTIEASLNDYHRIRDGRGRLTVPKVNRMHEENLAFITNQLSQKTTGKTVMVTHHVPTFEHYPPAYLGDAINEAFAVELVPLIEAKGPDYWIYGHHHSNVPDYMIGKTKMLTNQLGYVRRDEHLLFKHNAVIDL